MKLIITFTMILLSSSIYAQEEEQKVYIHSLDENVDLSSLERKEYKKIQGEGEVKSASTKLPSPKKLDQIFKEANLEQEVKDMDQLDKDLLFRKIVKYSVDDVATSYPLINKEKLITLKKIVGGK
jgi:hypothetical protein